jgi:hypothetical protein
LHFFFTFSPKKKGKEKNMYFMLLKSIALRHLRHIHHAFELCTSFASSTSTKKGGNLYRIKIPTCVDYYVFHLVSSACTEKGQKGVENQNRIHWNNNNSKSLSPKPSNIFLQQIFHTFVPLKCGHRKEAWCPKCMLLWGMIFPAGAHKSNA